MKFKIITSIRIFFCQLGFMAIAAQAVENPSIDTHLIQERTKSRSEVKRESLVKALNNPQTPKRKNESVNSLDRAVANAYKAVAENFSKIRNKVIPVGANDYSAVCHSDYIPNINDVLEAYHTARIGFPYKAPDEVMKALSQTFSFKYFYNSAENWKDKQRYYGLDVESSTSTETSRSAVETALNGSKWYSRGYGSRGQRSFTLSVIDGKNIGVREYDNEDASGFSTEEITWSVGVFEKSPYIKYALLTLEGKKLGRKEFVVFPRLSYATESSQLIEKSEFPSGMLDEILGEYTETDFPCDA